MNEDKELVEILNTLADDLINYDQRMKLAGAPDIRFVAKYVLKAKNAILTSKWGRMRLKEQESKFYYDKGYAAGQVTIKGQHPQKGESDGR